MQLSQRHATKSIRKNPGKPLHNLKEIKEIIKNKKKKLLQKCKELLNEYRWRIKDRDEAEKQAKELLNNHYSNNKLKINTAKRHC